MIKNKIKNKYYLIKILIQKKNKKSNNSKKANK